jgi:hypothetical protein
LPQVCLRVFLQPPPVCSGSLCVCNRPLLCRASLPWASLRWCLQPIAEKSQCLSTLVRGTDDVASHQRIPSLGPPSLHNRSRLYICKCLPPAPLPWTPFWPRSILLPFRFGGMSLDVKLPSPLWRSGIGLLVLPSAPSTSVFGQVDSAFSLRRNEPGSYIEIFKRLQWPLFCTCFVPTFFLCGSGESWAPL